MGENIKTMSRKEWSHDANSLEAINAGSLQRIADATEKMAQRHTELIRQRDDFERSANYWRGQSDQKDFNIRSLKGQVTKLRKKLAAAEIARHTEGA